MVRLGLLITLFKSLKGHRFSTMAVRYVVWDRVTYGAVWEQQKSWRASENEADSNLKGMCTSRDWKSHRWQFDGSSRSSGASPQLWFQRNVSIGDSPTKAKPAYFPPLICWFKGETIAESRWLFDLRSYMECVEIFCPSFISFVVLLYCSPCLIHCPSKTLLSSEVRSFVVLHP